MADAETNLENPFRVADFRVEPVLLRLTGTAGEKRLESKSMQVLVYLAGHAGQVVSRAELEAQIWPGRIVTEDAVTNTILKLRRAFGDDARRPRIIETIPKRGYRLIAAVVPLDEAGRAAPVATDVQTSRRVWPLAAGLSLLLLVVLGVYVFRGQTGGGAAPAIEKPAVAVLPFKNLGASPAQDYFANGITADLITDLSKVSGLLVIAPGTVFAYKDSGIEPREISAELAVDYVVVGSVQRSGERLRVNTQLLEAGAERALWAERYEGAPGEIFQMQDRLTAAVIEALQVELAPLERAMLGRRPTASIDAYDQYLLGVEAHGHRTPEQNRLAREYFQRSIDLDPSFARAYAGLALTHSRDAIDGWVANPSESLRQAAALAERAAAMDPSLAQVHFVSGQVDLFRRRYIEAIEATQRALRVDPNYADAYALSAWVLNYAGRTEQAEAAMSRALRLNPRPTGSYLEVLGEIRFAQHRYRDSASVFARVLEINPNYMRARLWSVAALAQAGDIDQAEWGLTELTVLEPDFSLQRLDFAFPFKDPRVLDALLDGLKMAGAPE